VRKPTEPRIVTIREYHCYRCGHNFRPRGKPKRCGHCKSPYWATPRRKTARKRHRKPLAGRRASQRDARPTKPVQPALASPEREI
jgi:DNA-directed RNA polymerase subunit RPC12/RpoP